MAEKPSTRKVFVKASIPNVTIGNFGGQEKKPELFDQFVAVELTEAELSLTGPKFIEAARKALERTLASKGREKAHVINGNCELNADGTDLRACRQVLGLEEYPKNIELFDERLIA